MESPGVGFWAIFWHLALHDWLSRTPCHHHTRILYKYNGRIFILGAIRADLFVAGAGSMTSGSRRDDEPRAASLPVMLHLSNMHCVNMHASGQASPRSARPSFRWLRIVEIGKLASQRLEICMHAASMSRRPSVY